MSNTSKAVSFRLTYVAAERKKNYKLASLTTTFKTVVLCYFFYDLNTIVNYFIQNHIVVKLSLTCSKIIKIKICCKNKMFAYHCSCYSCFTDFRGFSETIE